jgi:hypothetical protein
VVGFLNAKMNKKERVIFSRYGNRHLLLILTELGYDGLLPLFGRAAK